MEKHVTYEVLVHPADEGGYWAEVPSLPGCYTEAETINELQMNILEAITGWLEAVQMREIANRNRQEIEKLRLFDSPNRPSTVTLEICV